MRFSPLVFLILASSAFAEVNVQDAWIRASVAQQKSTGAYMRITASEDARLVEVRCAAAAVTELHEMAMDKDVMKMRALKSLDLGAGKTFELKPGSYHVMLIDLKQQLKEGEQIPLTLVMEDRGGKRQSIEVMAVVRALNSASKH